MKPTYWRHAKGEIFFDQPPYRYHFAAEDASVKGEDRGWATGITYRTTNIYHQLWKKISWGKWVLIPFLRIDVNRPLFDEEVKAAIRLFEGGFEVLPPPSQLRKLSRFVEENDCGWNKTKLVTLLRLLGEDECLT